MKIRKRLKFYYRYMTTTNRWRKWINAQVMLTLLAAAVFLTALTWTVPNSARSAQTSQAPALTLTVNPSAGPTQTPFPPEFYSNGQQTIGITFAGAVLVLIVVIGVIVFMPKKTDE